MIETISIDEIKVTNMTEGLSYVVGLCLPLYKEKEFNNKKYLIGSVNHNTVNEENIAVHFKEILGLLKKSNLNSICLLNNKNSTSFSISTKKGFSVLIENTNISKAESMEILITKFKEIINSSDECKKSFLRAIFDSRGSWDNSRHYFSVDVDRNHKLQSSIQSLFRSFDIEVELNQRAPDYPKNDQLRIRPRSVNVFLNKIGLYSIERKIILQKGIKEI